MAQLPRVASGAAALGPSSWLTVWWRGTNEGWRWEVQKMSALRGSMKTARAVSGWVGSIQGTNPLTLMHHSWNAKSPLRVHCLPRPTV